MSVYPKYGFNAEDLIKEHTITKYEIENVQKWLEQCPHIPELSVEQICIFLVSCKNSVDCVRKTIESYYTCKSTSPDIFSNRDVDGEAIQQNFQASNIALMPRRTKDGCAVVIGGLKDFNYYNFILANQAKTLFAVFDLSLFTGKPPSGLIFVMDVKGIGLMHLTRLKLGVLRKFFQYLQEGLPLRLKQVHIMNSNYVFDKGLVMCKPFIQKDLYDSILTHSSNMDHEEFFEKHIPADCFPEEYGGNLPDMETLANETMNDLRKMKSNYDLDELQTAMYRK